MIFAGLQKLTLLDFPGKVACTIFTPGCNFRCPFCHNAVLVTHRRDAERIDEAKIVEFLESRRNLLDGVCITGGEPLLHPEIADFIRLIKNMGFAVKLDTNGSFPDLLERLVGEGLVDYVAMDIKNSPRKYEQTSGTDGVLDDIVRSASFLMSGKTAFEFRTTVVEGLHDEEDFEQIGRWLAGDELYYLQRFADSGDVILPGLNPPTEQQLLRFRDVARTYLPNTNIR